MQTGRKNIIANEKGDDKHPDVLSNPSKPQLQAFFNTVINRHNSDPDRITSGGVKGIIHNQTEQHHWGDAYQMHHDDIAKHIGDQDSWNYKTATIGEDGKIIDTRSGYPVLVPGFDSTCLQPARATGASDKASFGEKMGVQTLPTGRKNIVANVVCNASGMEDGEDVRFHTPPRNQGQIVTVSYGSTGDNVIRRTHDGSVGQVEYHISKSHPSDEGDYWNGAPANKRWRKMSDKEIKQHKLL